MQKQKIILLFGVLFLAVSLFYVILIDESAKITTFEECEKNFVNKSWLVYKMSIYDGYGSVEKECFLWSGKKFAKQKIVQSDNIQSDFGNDQVEKAIINYLLTQKYFSWQTKANSRNFCAIENLDPGSGLFPLYVWALCEEFYMENGELKEGSGVSVPAKINYPNQLSFYDLSKFSYEVPGDGNQNPKDIRAIFPVNVQARIFSYNIEILNQKIKKIARDDFGK